MKTNPVTKLALALAFCLTAVPLASFSSLSTGCCVDEDSRRELTVYSEPEWAGMLSDAFGGLSLRLNNYTPVANEYDPSQTFAFYHPNDSSLTVAPLDLALTFDIPVARQDPYSMYINDVRSTGITLDARNGRAIISIQFEDSGAEVVGNCVDNVACICGDPHIDLNDMTVDVSMELGARGGRLAIVDVQALLDSTFEETGPCHNNACAFLCDALAPDRENQARTRVQEQVVNFINTNRGILEGLFNGHIEALGISDEIVAAEISGDGQLIITTERADSTCGDA